MGKPDEFPQDVWDAAMDAAAGLRNAVVWQSNASNEIIATCLAATTLAERKECAARADDRMKVLAQDLLTKNSEPQEKSAAFHMHNALMSARSFVTGAILDGAA